VSEITAGRLWTYAAAYAVGLGAHAWAHSRPVANVINEISVVLTFVLVVIAARWVSSLLQRST
jgi:hypothetical protein